MHRRTLGAHRGRITTAVVASVTTVVLLAAIWLAAYAILDATDDSSPGAPGRSLRYDTTSTSVVAVLPPQRPVSDAVPLTTSPQAAPAAWPMSEASAAPVAGAPVRSIQTAPPVRDVIIDIGGQPYSTDQYGAIDVGGLDPNAVVTTIGVRTDPPIRQIDILGWADGSGDWPRPLAELSGPVAYLALALQSRVTVALEPATYLPAAVIFDTEGGPVRVPTDTPTWLLDQRAVRGTNGPVVEQLHYTARSIVTADGTTAATTEGFLATPEARWVISTDG